MIPRRLRMWILIWTPALIVVLNLSTYPKDVPLSAGLEAVVRGFFSDVIARYPAWVMLLLGLAVLIPGVLGLLRRSKARAFNIVLLVLSLVLFVWAYRAGVTDEGWSLTGRTPGIGELLEDGRDAILCDCGSGQAIAAAVQRLRDPGGLPEAPRDPGHRAGVSG